MMTAPAHAETALSKRSGRVKVCQAKKPSGPQNRGRFEEVKESVRLFVMVCIVEHILSSTPQVMQGVFGENVQRVAVGKVKKVKSEKLELKNRLHYMCGGVI